MKVAVVIPTYNEKDNIEPLIKEILKLSSDYEVYIVDDNSPDGTGNIADAIAKKEDRVRVIHRKKKEGLGKAYRDAFEIVCKDEPDYVVQMDADFSHPPKAIPEMIKKMKTADVVIGSRYVNGISVVNWPIHRILLSWSANLYVRLLTRLEIADTTAGFKCFKREVLESIDFRKLKSEGYCFQIEMNYAASVLGYAFDEISIVFEDRKKGESKMSLEIILESFVKVLTLPFKKVSDYIKDDQSSSKNKKKGGSNKKELEKEDEDEDVEIKPLRKEKTKKG